MAVLRLLGGGTILENNIVQTGASAGSSIAAGVIFTLPALIILGYWQDFRYSWVLAIAGLGGLLGVLFSVPQATLDDRRGSACVPRRQGCGRSAQGRRESGPRRKDPRGRGRDRRIRQDRGRERSAHDSGQRGRRGLHRQIPRLHGHESVARAARRRLHRRAQCRHRRRLGLDPLVQYRDSDLLLLLPQHRSRACGTHRGCGRRRRSDRGHDLVGQNPLSRASARC